MSDADPTEKEILSLNDTEVSDVLDTEAPGDAEGDLIDTSQDENMEDPVRH